MLLISCPYCGPREETEFRFGGESRLPRPADPEALTDAEWADYLFNRINPKGMSAEEWVHIVGCRRWFWVNRNTVTHQIADTGPLSPRNEGPAL